MLKNRFYSSKIFIFFLAVFILISGKPLISQNHIKLDEIIKNSNKKDSFLVKTINDSAFILLNSDPDQAKEYCQTAIKISDEINYQKGKAIALTIIGLVYYRLGLYDRAMDIQLQALRISEKTNLIQQTSWVYNNIGNIHVKRKKYDLALLNFQKSIQLKELLRDTAGIAATYKNLSSLYAESGNYDSSMFYANKGLPLAESANDLRTYSLILNILGENCLKKNKFDLAEKYFSHALEFLSKKNSRYDRPKALNGLARVYLERKQFYRALDYFKQAYDETSRVGASFEKVNSLSGISECYYDMGRYKDAYDFHKKSAFISDSLFNVDVQSKISSLGFLYDYEKKENELSILSKEMELQNQRISYLNLIVVIITISLIIFIILLILIYRDRIKIKTHSKELKSINQTKDKLFSIIAHDLKNQVGNIAGVSQILADEFETLTNLERSNFIFGIKDEARGTSLLLENLLSWAQSQDKNIVLEPQNYQLLKIVDENIEILCELARYKSIELISNVQPDLIGFFDINTVNTVFRNLILNAIKYTGKDGKIVISGNDEGQHIKISVSDTGIGMKKDFQEQLFKCENFVSTVGTSGEKGIGLGLHLCKEFVEKNGGEISVESEIGKGSTFIFTLPK